MRLPGSFRDPNGSVFTREGVVFRQVNHLYREQYDFLIGSGLYDSFVNSMLLVPHEEVDVEEAKSPEVYKVLRPQPIPFISYPYEWSFSQLKDAALTTLEVQRKALEFGMTLKDASAFNVQFLRGRPVLIDTLSFQKYQEGEPWVAYRQFCQHFLAPLALIKYRHIGAVRLSQVYLDGVPLDLASSLLPMRSRLSPSMQMHIHFHARLQRKYSSKPGSRIRSGRRFPHRSFLGLIDSLESTIKRLRWRPVGTEWADYYSEDSYGPDSLRHKIEIVTGFLKEAAPKSVWDLGANTGLFSRLASDTGIETVSFDMDPAAVERNYLTVKRQNEENLLPLLLDLTNPSPRIGWANEERMDLVERGPADMVFALALLHHLAIAGNVPLGMIADFFSRLCN